MKHPREDELALFAGADLGFFERRRVARHLVDCPECRGQVGRFEMASSVLTEEAERLPHGLEWNRIGAEMTANIRLGVAAGECVAAPPVRMAWRPAAVLASAALVVVTSWWLSIPPARHQAAAGQPRVTEVAVLQSTSGGIEVKNKSGAALTLLRARASSPVLYVSSPGSLRERFVDAETGQVTINNVYSE